MIVQAPKQVDAVMVPFHPMVSWESLGLIPAIVFGRPSVDFADDCLLYRTARTNALTCNDVADFRTRGSLICYSYERMDFDNREFTIDGHRAILQDMRNAIRMGFTHILLSNPYIIELVANELRGELKIIISSQLDFNSSRSKVMLDALNDATAVTHVIVSQCQLTLESFREMTKAFKDYVLIVEADRWLSDVRIVNDRYYSVIFGRASIPALREAQRLTEDTRLLHHLRSIKPFLTEQSSNLLFKTGEVNGKDAEIVANVRSILGRRFDQLMTVDLHAWATVCDSDVNVKS